MFITGGGRESIVSAQQSSTSKGSGDCPVELNAHNTKLHFSEITKYTFNLPLSINKYAFLHINKSTHYKKNQKNSKTTAEIPKNGNLTERLLSLLYIQQLFKFNNVFSADRLFSIFIYFLIIRSIASCILKPIPLFSPYSPLFSVSVYLQYHALTLNRIPCIFKTPLPC